MDFPKIKKDVKKFLLNEDGNVSQKKIISISIPLILSSVFVQAGAHYSHDENDMISEGGGRNQKFDWYVDNDKVITGSTTSYTMPEFLFESGYGATVVIELDKEGTIVAVNGEKLKERKQHGTGIMNKGCYDATDDGTTHDCEFDKTCNVNIEVKTPIGRNKKYTFDMNYDDTTHASASGDCTLTDYGIEKTKNIPYSHGNSIIIANNDPINIKAKHDHSIRTEKIHFKSTRGRIWAD